MPPPFQQAAAFFASPSRIMTIGIIVAMDKELNLLLPLLKNVNPVSDALNRTFYPGNVGNHAVVAVKCGIGKVNAALGTKALIDSFHPDIIINTGVAGGTGATQNPARVLDVVLADRIAYHDVWCGPGTNPGQAAGCPQFFSCPLSPQIRSQIDAKEGLLASGDIFVDKPEDLRRILDLYPDAIAVDMESAAIAQTCLLENVPFICVRVVSDTPGDGGNAAAYDSFWLAAPERTFEVVEKLLSIL